MPTNRATTIGVVLVLVALPWLTRPSFGPVADNRAARIVRAAGFASLYGFLLVMVGLSRFASSRFDHFRAFDQANWEADVRAGAIVGAVVVIAVITAYALAVLALTSRRMSLAPATLTIGAVLGTGTALVVFALTPFGNAPDGVVVIPLVIVPPAALLAAGVLAGKRAGRDRDGWLAGVCAGGVAALLLTVLTVTMMLLSPSQVDLKWADPDPNVPHGTDYELRMSVGDSAVHYEFGLLIGPLAGLVLGGLGVFSVASGRREDEIALVRAD
ncbi:MAG: hypothetical protein ABIQ18_43055 [Umezawaea sp.]